MDDFREIAEARLAAREAKFGPVGNRERYLAAIINGLRAEGQPKPAPKQYADLRPDCPTCDGNGWVEAMPQGSYEFVARCPDCDRGRVNLRSADEPPSEPAVARAHLAEIRSGLRRLAAKQDVRHL